MTAKILGNHGPYVQNGVGGSGTRNVPDLSIGWIQIMGKSGDYAVVAASEVHGRDLVHRGYMIQGDGNANFTVEITLSNSGEAKNPNAQAEVPWVVPPSELTNITGAITSNAMYYYQGAFAALKITFSAPGIVWLVAR
jgi:hypothetical protein